MQTRKSETKTMLEASHDKASNKLSLLLLNTGTDSEFTVQYEFDITADQRIKFRQVRVAG